jgi:hypothetical protein
VLAAFFAVFYSLAKIARLKAGKATVFSWLIGVLLGPLVLYQLLSMLYLNIARALIAETFGSVIYVVFGIALLYWYRKLRGRYSKLIKMEKHLRTK